MSGLRKKAITAIILASVLIIITAGCIINQPPVKTESTEIPLHMNQALEALSDDLIMLEHSIIDDLQYLSREIETADELKIKETLEEYYSGNPCLTAVIYHDEASDKYISEPVFLEISLSSYSTHIAEKDFLEAGDLIVRNNVFTKYHGYQNLYYKPVYDENNIYRGYLIFVIDVYSLLYLHPDILGKDKLYDGYICFITDDKNNIIYSSIEEATGNVLSGQGFYDTLAYIPLVNSGDGACKYTSRGFYIYDADAQTEKITAWHTVYSSHGQKYTVYLIECLDDSELRTKDVFELNVLQALNDTRGAYVFSKTNTVTDFFDRINSGYYETDILLMDMNGNVAASSDSYKIGHNYLNNRGMYGISYVVEATHAAQQGGGYIYYLTPVERVVNPRAAQYTLGIVVPVNSECYLYSRVAGSKDVVMMNTDVRPDLTVLSRAILSEISKSGVDAVSDMINTKGYDALDLFVPDLKADINDVAILNFSGVVTASMKHPDLIGRSSTHKIDVYGDSSTRRAMMLAKTGGGFMPILVKNSKKDGYVDLRLAMIEPINDEYYIYTTAYIETFEDVLTPYLNQATPSE